MLGRKPPEVLVAGAGPVGLLAALTLARRGIRVQIVDRERRTGTHSYALALHAGSLGLLEELGILGGVLERAYRVRSIGLYDGAERRAELRVSELPVDHSFIAAMRQADLERLLEEALKQTGVHVLWNHQVARLEARPASVDLTIDTLDQESLGYSVAGTSWVVARSKNLEVPFVIGADGHRSTVRRAVGIDFPDAGSAQDFAVFEFKTDVDLGHEMRLNLARDSANVCWPLPEGFCRFSFEIPRAAVFEEREKDRSIVQLGGTPYPVLTDEHLTTLLRERAPWFRGRAEQVCWRMVVRFERRLAESFGSGRVWLAGDAGHLTGPVGVQSMNVGLREAHDLAGAIAGCLRDGGGPAGLESYGRARQAEWTRLLVQGPKAGAKTDPWIASNATRLLPCIPASGEDLSRLAAQIGLAC
jgi:2-polyprenyl-6-methoxyphenol hydroxylase-like FAD-dependent oxidoreductase